MNKEEYAKAEEEQIEKEFAKTTGMKETCCICNKPVSSKLAVTALRSTMGYYACCEEHYKPVLEILDSCRLELNEMLYTIAINSK